MTWFTWMLIVLAVVVVVVILLELVRPRRSRRNPSTNQREVDQGDAFLRGGNELNNRLGRSDGPGPY